MGAKITHSMLQAGEAVLDRAIELAGLPPSLLVSASVRDVYIAMETARLFPKRSALTRREAKGVQDADTPNEQ